MCMFIYIHACMHIHALTYNLITSPSGQNKIETNPENPEKTEKTEKTKKTEKNKQKQKKAEADGCIVAMQDVWWS